MVGIARALRGLKCVQLRVGLAVLGERVLGTLPSAAKTYSLFGHWERGLRLLPLLLLSLLLLLLRLLLSWLLLLLLWLLLLLLLLLLPWLLLLRLLLPWLLLLRLLLILLLLPLLVLLLVLLVLLVLLLLRLLLLCLLLLLLLLLLLENMVSSHGLLHYQVLLSGFGDPQLQSDLVVVLEVTQVTKLWLLGGLL
jgi:hypothetical protein